MPAYLIQWPSAQKLLLEAFGLRWFVLCMDILVCVNVSSINVSFYS